MIMVLVLTRITKNSPANVVPLIAAATLSEKDLGGELSLKEKNVISLYK